MSEADPVLPGWFTTGAEPHLIGSRCSACGTYYFPKLESFCRNPACESTQFETVELSRTGKLWSFTDACRPHLVLHQCRLQAARALCRQRAVRTLRHRRGGAGA